jgi:hypothetical protein
MDSFSQNDPTPKVAEAMAKAIPTLKHSTPKHPSDQSFFIKDMLPDGIT